MKKFKIFLVASAFVLSASAAFISKASGSIPVARKTAFDQILYDPNSSCAQFTCTASGSISCNNYDQTLVSTAPRVCQNPLVTTLKHN